MAGRVNVKFVIILSVGLVLLFGGVAAAVGWVLLKSGEDYANLARQAEAEGELKKAASNWGRAVGHDPSNLEWLEAWLEVEQQIVPETRLEYIEAFNKKYYAILRTIATVKQNDVEAHETHLDIQWQQLQGDTRLETQESFIREVDRVVGLFALAPGGQQSDADFLRWYSGASIVVLMGAGTADEDLKQRAFDDLTAAIAARPESFKPVEQLYTWHAASAEEARLDRDFEAAEAAAAEASAVLAGFVEANPDNAAATTMSLLDRQQTDLRKVDLDQAPEQIVEQRLAVIADYQPEYEALAGKLGNEWGSQVDFQTAQRFQSLAQRMNPTGWFDASEAVWGRAVANEPDSSLLMYARARFLRAADRREQAMQAFKQVQNLPNAPLSMEGLSRFRWRPEAEYERANLAIELWQTADAQGEDADELLENAKSLRDEMAATRAESDPQLLLVNAKLAIAEEDFNAADRLLKRFNTAVLRPNAEALRLTGVVRRQLGEDGAARRAFEQALELDPQNAFTLLSLADIARELKDYDGAAEYLGRTIEIRPTDENLKNQLRRLDIVRGVAEASDPCEAVRLNAQRYLDEGDSVAYAEELERGVEECGDAAFSIELAQVRARQGDLDGARAAIEQGLRLHPDNQDLIAFDSIFQGDDPISEAIAVVEASDASEAEKARRKFTILLNSSRRDEARAALDDAIELNPDDTELLTTKFDFALLDNDIDQAASLARRLGDADADGAGGRTFRAAVAILEGKLEEAERLLRAAEEEGSTNARTVRLLGQVLSQRGRDQEALDAYNRAYQLSPGETETLVPYLDALMRSGQADTALEVARAARAVAQSDRRFVSRWLALEGEVGDRQLALDERLKRAESNPNDIENRAQVVALLMEVGQYDEARRQLDELRSTDDSLALVALDARWYADQNDLNAARSVFATYLVEQGGELDGPEAYITFGNFLIENGDLNGGLSTIRQGRRFQDPQEPTADLVLGQQLFTYNRNAEAAQLYEGLIAKLDPDAPRTVGLRLRLAEVYTRLNEFDKAAASIEQVTGEQRDGLAASLLGSDIARGQGRYDEALDMLDSTVADFPESSLALLKRAELRIRREEYDDALADLDAALSIQPNSTVGRRLRATVRFETGDQRGAFDDIRAAVAAAPDDNQLRLSAVQRFIAADRLADATDLVEEGIERQPTDIRLKVGAGDIFASIDEHRRAVRFYELAWNQAKTIPIAQRYINSLLSQSPPQVRDARQVTTDRELVEGSAPAPIATMRARVEAADDNLPQAFAQLDSAYSEISNERDTLSVWMDSLPDVLGGEDEAADYLERLAGSRTLTPWAEIFRGRLLTSLEDRRAEGIAVLESRLEAETDAGRRLATLRVLSIGLYRDDRTEEAVTRLREALEIAPGNPDLLNNLAYLLCTELERCDDALESAVRAAELAPGRWDIADTLGVVQLEAGQTGESLVTLENALSLAATPADRASVKLNLARAANATGDNARASRLVSEVRTLLETDEQARERLADRLAKVEAEL